ncbi:thymidylate synthase [Metalysinibacillus jejuensis]|uniref:thymidylate synthase n=1 Tax=Metalysinibacillus jejuensis TaxID=914327 RepID=UPI000D3B33C2|nr:thymidylate synthase [Metalysinibacillus jejuensis]
MQKIYETIGEAWVDALKDVYNSKDFVEDYKEVLNFQTSFLHNVQSDFIIAQDARVQADTLEMRKVFFTAEENIFGHSYYNTGKGPFGNNGVEDIITLLKENTTSKRAALSYPPYAHGKVPCINLIHFMIRENQLVVHYYSRGQDMYRKFPCDAICIAEMAQEVATALDIPIHSITATISSAHIYEYDFEKTVTYLEQQAVGV